MKVLVTGGAGYIGSVVASQLVAAGHGVVVYDNLSHGHADAVTAPARLVVGDLGDRAALDKVFADFRPEAVMHFAASIEAGESMHVPEKFFRNNTANALTLLEAMLASGTRRLVFSSTAALYGNPARTPIEEGDALSPTNAYGESKLLVERMLAWFHRIHGFSAACLRYFNAAGATAELGERHHPETHLIPLVLQVASGRRTHISIFGDDYPTPDGSCVRDYVHVADLASAHQLALNALANSAAPELLAYNLGSGQGFSVKEVIACARRVTGHPIPAKVEPRRPGDPAVLVASSEKSAANSAGGRGTKPSMTSSAAPGSMRRNTASRNQQCHSVRGKVNRTSAAPHANPAVGLEWEDQKTCQSPKTRRFPASPTM